MGKEEENGDNNLFKSLYSCPGPMAKGKSDTECDMKSRTRKEAGLRSRMLLHRMAGIVPETDAG